MSLIRFNNSRPLSYLEKFFDDDNNWLFRDNWFRGFDSTGKVNVKENENDYSIDVSAPGFKKEELNIQIEDGVMTITGEHLNEKNDSDEKYSRREFSKQSFERSFRIPKNVDENGYDAKFEDGILKITVNKPKELPKIEKKIEIK